MSATGTASDPAWIGMISDIAPDGTANDGTARQVARESGARVAGTLYVDSLSAPDGPVPTYLDLVRHDVAVIAAGLARPMRTASADAAPWIAVGGITIVTALAALVGLALITRRRRGARPPA